MKFLLTLALALAVMATPVMATPMPMPDDPVAFASSLDETTIAAPTFNVIASQPAEALACTTSGLRADVAYFSLPLYTSFTSAPIDAEPGWRT